MSYDDALKVRSQVLNLPLPEGCDRAAFHALLTAGVRHCLEQELAELDDRRRGVKDAAVFLSESREWDRVARRIRERDDARRTGAYIERVVSR
ncbi:hypothetical protein [Gordonia sp. NB41Y]|uniref:hypothetical protein n=1 Tax=Gordonia sp. NB41Y TaxID=875808 RepID=UPI0002BEFB7A|nr:hypothetical protein [Gordonia sp. NB41Y]EMP13503.1 3-oxoadipate enol-lactonase [Gordonia sp. NB41Y]WLP91441.1 DUF2742 domain-containing protein [Gordonia sp. NB41Y]